jgi:hypothetical protein
MLVPRSSLLSALLPSTEDEQSVVSLPGVEAATVMLLLDILYGGRSVSCLLSRRTLTLDV